MDQCQPAPPAAPRQRRSSRQVRALILAAARAEFAAQGYDGSTTRAIASRAGVLEPLIFGHFGSKAALFTEAVIEPITAAFTEGVLASESYPLDGSEVRMREFIKAIYAIYRENGELFKALIKASGQHSANFGGALEDYFAKAEARQRIAFGHGDQPFDVEPRLSVRLLFGMMVSTILLHEWMFPENPPSEHEMISALSRLMHKAASQPQVMP